MATTTPDNLYSPDAGNQYNLIPDLATMQASTQAALNQRANFYRGTSTERNALSTAGSALNGTYWSDTNGTQHLYRYNGTAWVDQTPVNDTGWLTVPMLAAFSTSTLAVRVLNGHVQWRGNIAQNTGTFPNSATLVGNLPLDEARPTGYCRIFVPGFVSPTMNGHFIELNSDTNNIRVNAVGATSSTAYTGGINYLSNAA